ncbi:unnamed protein product [Caenorhabditis bovis]|uniref:G-protein coupled receptors family 1 profile domain-containing protein n=1 Tax=Caenorhabditis bovis TaxID=2654633 RepID=A0A8S1ELP8_9PELO|nr:unnamed protein product [Caenorhabditis bovis]
MSHVVDENQAFIDEWTISSRLLFYTVVIISVMALPMLVASLIYVMLRRKSQFVSYLCSILSANMVLLGTLFASVIIEKMNIIDDWLPGSISCKATAFLVNTSSCFIHWTWVVMYAQRFLFVFYPLRARRSRWKSYYILTGVLISSALLQLWTLLFITSRHVDVSFHDVERIYCGDDPSYSSSKIIIIFVECVIAFFIPLTLTILADISVLMFKNSCHEQFTLVANEEIGDGTRKQSNMKIVSSNTIRSSERRRSMAIRRCLASATINLLLNLPNYSLQLFDEFYPLRNNPSTDVRRKFLKIDAFVYILYLLQFLISPLYIFILTRNVKRRPS